VNTYQQLWVDYLDQPREVSLETLARCNAACTFCPYPTLERIGTKMSDDLIDRIVREMARFEKPFYFSPFKVNEPLLDVRVLPLLRRMNSEVPKASLRLFSNGTTLTPRNCAEISELTRLDCLWVSLNEYRPAEYEALMGIPFDRTAARLDDLHASGFPHKVVLSTVGFPNEDFRRYCFDRWPDFESVAIKRDAWIDFTHPDRDVVPNTPCVRWFELSIMANGRVSLCCMDGKGEYAIGDVTTNSLLDVYNAPVWRERREALWSRRRVHPCSTCTY
jgi:sulfatase maturation enzyme AslB (radical SAM superfamily)